jgi:predicted ribosome quality control (RQC) complex YloA/Tae2 family protein
MLTNHHTLRLLVSTIKPFIEKNQVETIFSQEKDEFVVRFSPAAMFLVVSCNPALNAFYLHPRFARARKNTVDIFPCVRGTIADIAVHPADRTISLVLSDGVRLQIRLFGRDAHAIVLDSTDTVVDAFRKDISSVSPLPPPKERKELHDLIPLMRQRGTSDLIRTARPTWGTLVIAEALYRSGAPAATPPDQLNPEEVHALGNTLTDLDAELDHPRARVYVGSQAAPIFSIIPLHHVAGMEERIFDDPHEAVRLFVGMTRTGKFLSDERDELIRKIRELVRKTERSLAATEKDLAASGRADEYERFGRLIVGNLHAVHKGDEHADLEDGGAIVRIPLQPHLSPAQNGQRFFEKAKKTRAAHQLGLRRTAGLKSQLSIMERLLDDLSAVSSREEFRELLGARSADLSILGLSQRQQETAQLPFRTFVVDGGFEVWAGKNSRSNDELTLRHAKPDDLWFHARGAGGSHVILRVRTGKGEPGKKALHQAAAIAAWFSKMKNARMVPVAMTRKKFVRKPRGAPPGTVVIEREEVLFAEPKLPERSTTEEPA